MYTELCTRMSVLQILCVGDTTQHGKLGSLVPALSMEAQILHICTYCFSFITNPQSTCTEGAPLGNVLLCIFSSYWSMNKTLTDWSGRMISRIVDKEDSGKYRQRGVGM